jgi:hypothetical protein
LRIRIDQLVVGDELDRVFERQWNRRHEKDRFILAGGTDVGELLGLDRIHDQIVVPAVDPDHHAFVHALAGAHEHPPALLQLPQRIRDRIAVLGGNQHAVAPLGNVALHGRVAVEDVARESRPARQVHELALKSDQPASRNAVVEARASSAIGFHVQELAAACAERFHDRALVPVLQVDGELLEGLAALAVALLQHHARPGHCKFIAFAPHVLEQDGEMQLAATKDRKHVGIRGVLDPERHVGQQLAREPLAQVAAGDVLPVAPGQRRSIDLELHRQRRLIDRDQRQGLRSVDRGQRRPDGKIVDPGDQHDVAGGSRFQRHPVQAGEAEDLSDPCPHGLAPAVQHDDLLPGHEPAAPDAADAEPADIARIVERADLQLQRRFRIARRRRHPRQYGLEQRPQIGAGGLGIERRVAMQRGRVDDREVELLLVRPEPVEELESLVDHPLGARTRTVDLVDHDDRLQTLRERLASDEARLRHRTLDRVDQQQHAIDHRQDALDLPTEISVAGRIDDVDVRSAVLDRAVLGEDRDPSLALEVVAVHDALGHVLVRGERARLAQELVDQGGLAVVDMGDDGDVAELPGGGHVASRKRNESF